MYDHLSSCSFCLGDYHFDWLRKPFLDLTIVPLKRETAEAIGLKCLAWLISEEDLLPVFLGSTGASEADLRAGATEPAFLGSVLDFLLMDDVWVLRFCEAADLAPEMPMQARQALPGGHNVHWT